MESKAVFFSWLNCLSWDVHITDQSIIFWRLLERFSSQHQIQEASSKADSANGLEK